MFPVTLHSPALASVLCWRGTLDNYVSKVTSRMFYYYIVPWIRTLQTRSCCATCSATRSWTASRCRACTKCRASTLSFASAFPRSAWPASYTPRTLSSCLATRASSMCGHGPAEIRSWREAFHPSSELLNREVGARGETGNFQICNLEDVTTQRGLLIGAKLYRCAVIINGFVCMRFWEGELYIVSN